MIQYPFLIPECNVDTVFIESLHYQSPNHVLSINQVSNILENRPLQRAMGFIDDDKKKPKYFSDFIQIESVDHVRLLKHKVRDHYLVVVQPAMDEFIYCICKELEIDLSKYKFPNELKAFINLTKKEAIKSNPHFRNLLNTIIQKNHPTIKKISHWIKKYSPYTKT